MNAREVLQRTAKGTLLGTLHLFYPPQCPLCESPLADSERLRFVCEGCLAHIRRLEPPWCALCGEPLGRALCERCAQEEIPFERARSFGFYEGPLARLIQLMKYHKERALIRELVPLLFAVYQQEEKISEGVEGITFVPMSPRSERARGFNPSRLMAEALGRLVGKPVFCTLSKIRETRPQAELAGSERLKNLTDAFAPLSQARCQSVLLIDDVYTTGATAKECSRALRSAGYKHIYVLTVARTPLSSEPEHAS